MKQFTRKFSVRTGKFLPIKFKAAVYQSRYIDGIAMSEQHLCYCIEKKNATLIAEILNRELANHDELYHDLHPDE